MVCRGVARELLLGAAAFLGPLLLKAFSQRDPLAIDTERGLHFMA